MGSGRRQRSRLRALCTWAEAVAAPQGRAAEPEPGAEAPSSIPAQEPPGAAGDPWPTSLLLLLVTVTQTRSPRESLPPLPLWPLARPARPSPWPALASPGRRVGSPAAFRSQPVRQSQPEERGRGHLHAARRPPLAPRPRGAAAPPGRPFARRAFRRPARPRFLAAFLAAPRLARGSGCGSRPGRPDSGTRTSEKGPARGEAREGGPGLLPVGCGPKGRAPRSPQLPHRPRPHL